MQAWISANGGLLATAALVVAVYNIVFSAIASVCNKLKVQEPSFLQKAGSYGSVLAGWLGGNTPSVPAPQQPPAPPSS